MHRQTTRTTLSAFDGVLFLFRPRLLYNKRAGRYVRGDRRTVILMYNPLNYKTMGRKKNAAATAETTAKGIVAKLGNIETKGLVINGSNFRPLFLPEHCEGWKNWCLTGAVCEDKLYLRDEFFELELSDGEEVSFATADFEKAIMLLQDPEDFEKFVLDSEGEEDFGLRYNKIVCMAVSIIADYAKFIKRSYGIEVPSGDD